MFGIARKEKKVDRKLTSTAINDRHLGRCCLADMKNMPEYERYFRLGAM